MRTPYHFFQKDPPDISCIYNTMQWKLDFEGEIAPQHHRCAIFLGPFLNLHPVCTIKPTWKVRPKIGSQLYLTNAHGSSYKDKCGPTFLSQCESFETLFFMTLHIGPHLNDICSCVSHFELYLRENGLSLTPNLYRQRKRGLWTNRKFQATVITKNWLKEFAWDAYNCVITNI